MARPLAPVKNVRNGGCRRWPCRHGHGWRHGQSPWRSRRTMPIDSSFRPLRRAMPAEQGKVGRRLLVEGRDAHQPGDIESRRPRAGNQAVGIGRQAAGLLLLLAGVDLDETSRPASGSGHRLDESGDQPAGGRRSRSRRKRVTASTALLVCRAPTRWSSRPSRSWSRAGHFDAAS